MGNSNLINGRGIESVDTINVTSNMFFFLIEKYIDGLMLLINILFGLSKNIYINELDK